MTNTDIYFLEKIREFKKIEQEFIKFTYEYPTPSNEKESENFMAKVIELSFDAVEKRNAILFEMHDISEIQICDPEVKKSIDKLRKDEKFESLHFAKNLALLLNKDIDNYNDKIRIKLEDYFSENKHEELWNDFFSWFHIPSYYYRRAQVGAIITSSKLPSNIILYFEEIKNAFAYSLDKSCISLSRTLLEIALHDKLKKKGVFQKSNKVIDFSREDTLNRYISIAKTNNLISGKQKDLALKIRETGNNVLHIKDSADFSVRGLALKTIKDTVDVIEYLYRMDC